jgi:hypothetical protein
VDRPKAKGTSSTIIALDGVDILGTGKIFSHLIKDQKHTFKHRPKISPSQDENFVIMDN